MGTCARHPSTAAYRKVGQLRIALSEQVLQVNLSGGREVHGGQAAHRRGREEKALRD